MNRTSLAIVCVAIATFMVSFALLWPDRHAPPAIASTPLPRSSASKTNDSAPANVSSMVRGDADPSAATRPARVGTAPTSMVEDSGAPIEVPDANFVLVSNKTPPANSDGPPLPVIFAIAKNEAMIDEPTPDGESKRVSRSVNEATLMSQGDRALGITAIEVNVATQETSQIAFSLGAGVLKTFNVADGLKMLSGDQLILRSPSFQDLTRTIP